jgi:hypothetical protein
VPSNDISDEAIKKYYDGNPDKFIMPEQAHIAQLLISTLDPDTQQPLSSVQIKVKEKLAKEVKAKADKGEDFAQLVKEYSDDVPSKDRGGVYPPFYRGKMSRQFAAIEIAAFTLQTNQVSDPVETMYGFHIIKLLDKIPPEKQPLEKVAPLIRDEIINADVNKQLAAYSQKLKAQYDVKTLEPDPVSDLSPPPQTPGAGR